MNIESAVKKTHLGIYGVFEKNNRILLLRKSRGPYKSMWDLPGGRPIHGESIFQTLQREVFEETGILLFKVSPYCNESFVVEYKDAETLTSLHHTCLIYHALEFDDSAIKKNIVEEDVAGCSWIEKSKLDQLPVSRVVLCIMYSLLLKT
jgi:8-oxo-dGTP diphosphatase